MGKLAIETRGLKKSFGKTHAVAGVDLAVSAGGVYGVLGPNGAGKTTAIRMLATLLHPDAGEAQVLGYDVVRDARAVRSRVGLTGQFASVDEDLTGVENLLLLARLLGYSRRQGRERAADLLDAFGLAEAADRQVKKYSGGMRRRIDIAASLVVTPELIFLDEPTTGLDPRSRNQVWEIVRGMVAEGTTVLLTTQYLDEADQLADRIAVIEHGKLIAEGTSSELKASVGSGALRVRLREPRDRLQAQGLLAHLLGADVETLHSALSAEARPPSPSGLSASRTFGWRALLKIKHVPEQLADVIFIPILFTLMFTYLFGGALSGSTGNYLQSLLPGTLAMTLVLVSVYTGVGLNTDITKGIFDRFRSLPIWRPAALVGALLGDAARNLLAAAIVIALGLAMGFRPDAGAVGVLLAAALLLVFSFSVAWIWTALALVLRTPSAVSNASLLFVFPLTFASNVFVEPRTMPGWLQAFVDVNPISHLVTAERGLMAGTATAGQITWVLLAATLLIAVFAPLTMHLYRSKS